MPRSRELRSVCSDMVSHIMSRNFDLDGYWGMGVLYQTAYNSGTKQVRLEINLREDNVHGPVEMVLRFWCLKTSLYRQKLLKRFANRVEIEINFDTPASETGHTVQTGDPYRISAMIFGNDKKVYSFNAKGNCYRVYDRRFKPIRRPAELSPLGFVYRL